VGRILSGSHGPCFHVSSNLPFCTACPVSLLWKKCAEYLTISHSDTASIPVRHVLFHVSSGGSFSDWYVDIHYIFNRQIKK
jgi:hypothetical protein